MHTCAYFCHKMVHCGIYGWCVVGHLSGALWEWEFVYCLPVISMVVEMVIKNDIRAYDIHIYACISHRNIWITWKEILYHTISPPTTGSVFQNVIFILLFTIAKIFIHGIGYYSVSALWALMAWWFIAKATVNDIISTQPHMLWNECFLV